MSPFDINQGGSVLETKNYQSTMTSEADVID